MPTGTRRWPLLKIPFKFFSLFSNGSLPRAHTLRPKNNLIKQLTESND